MALVFTPAPPPGALFEPTPTDTLPDRFERQAALYPDHWAVRSTAGALTYRALDQAANRIAHALLERLGPGPGMVGVLIDPSATAVAALVGLLKAGKTWVPLDPAVPPARLNLILADSTLALLLHDAPTAALAAALDGPAPRLDLADLAAGYPATPPARALTPDALAFLLYTSGSTGRPKGVLQTHANILHAIAAHTAALALGPADRFILLTPFSHLTGCTATMRALLNGGAVIPYALARTGLPGLTRLMQAEGITIYQSVPSVYRRWVGTLRGGETFPALRVVHLGGEAVSRNDVTLFRRHFGPPTRLLHNLGSTEAYSYRQMFIAPDLALADSLVPVGYAIPGKEVLVVDAAGQPVPAGQVGEIVVKSAYLSPGYWQRPDLTAAAFTPVPGEPGVRLFRTGDLGRLLPDGCLFHLGRQDAQVKIRGQRIEIGEVEVALQEHPNVREVAVLAVPRADGHALAAYLAPHTLPGPSLPELHAFLSQCLPEVFIPTSLVVLPALPYLPNGKLDRRALAEAAAAPLVPATPVDAPQTPTEAALLPLWCAALDLPAVGRHAHFFELGGHSLAAISLFSQIELVLGLKLPVSLLAQHPTLAQLAAVLDQPAAESLLVPLHPAGLRPPFFCVHDVGGSIGRFAQLAELLGADQPFYALRGRGQEGEAPPEDNLETMAADYLALVRQVQPHGPYYLGGYCLGGVVAFEMGRQLRAAGEPVALVAIFEGYAPLRTMPAIPFWSPRKWPAMLRNLPGWVADHLDLGPRYTWDRFWHVTRQLSKQQLVRLGVRGPLAVGEVVRGADHMPDHSQAVVAAHLRASRSYQPPPSDLAVTLFNCRRQSMLRDPDPRRGWHRLAQRGLTIQVVAGSHHTLLEPAHVASLAQALRASLPAAPAA